MRRRGTAFVLAFLALTVPTTILPALAQDAAGVAVLSSPLEVGTVVDDGPTTYTTPTPKAVDGDISDWTGEATRLGGTTVMDRGEIIYQDYIFDAYGADDGKDAARQELLAASVVGDDLAGNRVNAISQAGGEQFGADDYDPTGGVVAGPANYGDAAVSREQRAAADLVDVRIAADDSTLYFLFRTVTMTDPAQLAVVVVADTDPSTADQGPLRSVPFNTGLETATGDVAFMFTADGVMAGDTGTGALTWATFAPGSVAVNASGYTNAMEASIPLDAITGPSDPDGPATSLVIGTGLNHNGLYLRDVATGEASTNILNLVRRESVVSNWFDMGQALALLDGHVGDPGSGEAMFVDPVELAAGATRGYAVQPGYHSLIFRSDEAISSERGLEGVWQHTGLFLPSNWEPGVAAPMTVWLHWRGGTAHQAAAWTPRVFEDLGEDHDGIVISPRGRGTSTWYLCAGHLDVLEAMDSVLGDDRWAIDEDRVYVSGYSMGGFGSYLFGFLYPDRFAGAFPISGATTHGLWVGVDDERARDVYTDENGADPQASLMFRLIENARNVPYVINHGTNDELVPISGVTRMASRFAELGYQHRLYVFPGYEHYTQAIIDEWQEGADYLHGQVRDTDPARVVYKRVPALEHAIETAEGCPLDLDLDVDGAYWLSGMTARNGDYGDLTNAAYASIERPNTGIEHVPVPEAGAASPPGHSTPYVMEGLAWLATPEPCSVDETLACASTGDAPMVASFENVATVTIDTVRMGGWTAGFDATVTTDGPTTLTLEGPWTGASSVAVTEGLPAAWQFDGTDLVIALPGAGKYELSVQT